jgi:hypothetical protein
MVVVQWLSAGMGGYMAGRLRLRWNYFDKDEVFFRDTAHGFLAWGLALAVVVIFAASMAVGVAGTAATGAAAVTAAQGEDSSMNYYADSLFRTDTPAQTDTAGANNAETARILTEGLSGNFAQDDKTYLAQLVAQRTGLSEEEAENRVDIVIAKAKAAADEARKAAATLAIANALALAIGAFISAVAAGYGGRLRDE